MLGVLCAVQLWEPVKLFWPSLITIKWSQACTLITAYTGSVCARVYWGSLRHSRGNQDNATLSNLQHLVTETQKITLLLHSMIEKWHKSQNLNFVLEGVKMTGRKSDEMMKPWYCEKMHLHRPFKCTYKSKGSLGKQCITCSNVDFCA